MASQRSGVSVLAAVVVLALSASVHAQTEDPEALVHEGIALRRAGRDDQALERFRRAWEIGHALNALGQIGLAEQALGQWVAAEMHVREVLTHGDDGWVQQHRAVVEAAYDVIRQHVGLLDVRGEPAGAELVIDGTVVGTLPLEAPLHVLVGNISLELRRAGYLPSSRSVAIRSGQLARESVTLISIATLASPAPTSEPNGGLSPVRVAGVVVATVGLAAIIGGVIAAAIETPTASGCQSGTIHSPLCPVATAEQTAGFVVIAGGAVAGVAGALMFFLGPRSRSVPTARAGWICGPAILGVGGCAGRF